ncbi:MAG: hypothetical protein Q4A34_02615 [Candidatus Saccharibacteria bacterium]|nr:hypothetical protein [Candidatus Saccharibacteria bacterium]
MNRRRIIIISTIVVFFIAAAYGVFSSIAVNKAYTITFQPQKQNLIAHITPEVEPTASPITIQDESSTRLKQGGYIISISSRDNSLEEKTFKIAVDKDNTITLDSTYTADFLQRTLVKERTPINNLILSTYPSLQHNFIRKKEALLKSDLTWYAASYVQKNLEKGNPGDSYTIILHKEGDVWVVKSRPQIINTKFNTRNIPDHILSEVYREMSIFSAA